MTNEKDIVHQSGDYWVLKHKKGHTVYMDKMMTAEAVATFDVGPDGFSKAIAYCNYKSNQACQEIVSQIQSARDH